MITQIHSQLCPLILSILLVACNAAEDTDTSASNLSISNHAIILGSEPQTAFAHLVIDLNKLGTEGSFSLPDGVADNEAFEIHDTTLVTARKMLAPSYSIQIQWHNQRGERQVEDFSLFTVNHEQIVPGQRMGEIAFMGQAGQDLRHRQPDRLVTFTGYDRYFFEQEGYVVDICSATDRLIAISVNQSHKLANTLMMETSLGFNSSLQDVLDQLGPPDASPGFQNYRAYVYQLDPISSLTFGYLNDAPHKAYDISISRRYCPTTKD